jgi:hypothetical protein
MNLEDKIAALRSINDGLRETLLLVQDAAARGEIGVLDVAATCGGGCYTLWDRVDAALLPERTDQAEVMSLAGEGFAIGERGHWYSPAVVRKKLTAEREMRLAIATDLQEYLYRVASQVPFEHAEWARERGEALLAALRSNVGGNRLAPTQEQR